MNSIYFTKKECLVLFEMCSLLLDGGDMILDEDVKKTIGDIEYKITMFWKSRHSKEGIM